MQKNRLAAQLSRPVSMVSFQPHEVIWWLCAARLAKPRGSSHNRLVRTLKISDTRQDLEALQCMDHCLMPLICAQLPEGSEQTVHDLVWYQSAFPHCTTYSNFFGRRTSESLSLPLETPPHPTGLQHKRQLSVRPSRTRIEHRESSSAHLPIGKPPQLLPYLAWKPPRRQRARPHPTRCTARGTARENSAPRMPILTNHVILSRSASTDGKRRKHPFPMQPANADRPIIGGPRCKSQ